MAQGRSITLLQPWELELLCGCLLQFFLILSKGKPEYLQITGVTVTARKDTLAFVLNMKYEVTNLRCLIEKIV